MNSLTNVMNSCSFCPAVASPSSAPVNTNAAVLASLASNAFKYLVNASDLLCILFFLSTAIAFVLSVLEFKRFISALNKPASLCLSESGSQDQFESEKINRARYNKRPSIDYSSAEEQAEEAPKVKSPKLMTIESNIIEEQQPKIRSRRSSLPRSPFKTIELDVQVQDCQVPLSPNHERISLVEEDEDLVEAKNSNVLVIQCDEQQEQLPFEWYLRWNLPDDALETLSFSEKSRRFYHLTTYGEVKQQHEVIQLQDNRANKPEKKPFDWYLKWDVSAEELEQLSFAEKSARFYHLTEYGELDRQLHTAIKPPEEQLFEEIKKPMNLITDLVVHANNIDIPKYQIYLLQQNHQLTCLMLKGLKPRKEDYCITSILRGRIDYPMLMLAEKYYMKPMIKYSLPLPEKKKQEQIDKVQWGKPLTNEQLRNILFIIA